MDVLDFDFEKQGEGDVPLMKQVESSAYPIRAQTDPNVATSSAAEATSSVPKSSSEQAVIKIVSLIPISSKEAGGSSGSQAGRKSILDDVDEGLEIRTKALSWVRI
ncbi:hypothetical protein Hanom_Chr14g01272631 [Helianthus anomalus]